MLKVGGENVVVFEIECVIVEMDEVVEVVVVGKVHAILDEVFVVFIILVTSDVSGFGEKVQVRCKVLFVEVGGSFLFLSLLSAGLMSSFFVALRIVTGKQIGRAHV